MHISHATNANSKWMIISSFKCCCTTHIFHASTQIRYQSIGRKFVVFENEFESMSYTICCGNSTVLKIININFIRDFPTKSPGFIFRIPSQFTIGGERFHGMLYRIVLAKTDKLIVDRRNLLLLRSRVGGSFNYPTSHFIFIAVALTNTIIESSMKSTLCVVIHSIIVRLSDEENNYEIFHASK